VIALAIFLALALLFIAAPLALGAWIVGQIVGRFFS
jgi:hypothetical protein